jgi:hypothetical protein
VNSQAIREADRTSASRPLNKWSPHTFASLQQLQTLFETVKGHALYTNIQPNAKRFASCLFLFQVRPGQIEQEHLDTSPPLSLSLSNIDGIDGC